MQTKILISVICLQFCNVQCSLAGLQDWNLRKYHQSDYDAVLDIARVVDYNTNLLRDVKVEAVWFNRTRRAINGSGWVLDDWTRDFQIQIRMFRFTSNEYRFFPLNIDFNACDEWDRNLFEAQKIIKHYSNFYRCPPKKGFYWIKQAWANMEALPPFMPPGSYKLVATYCHRNNFAAKLEVYFRVVSAKLV